MDTSRFTFSGKEISMRSFFHKNFIFALFLLFASSAAIAPGAELAHGLNHLEESYASGDIALSGTEPFSDELDPEAQCDLCDSLTNGRLAIAGVADGVVARLEATSRVEVLAPSASLQSIRYAPESPRGPPLS